ncbi:MAG: hypothetical protein IT205_10395 [Fimbriimonadaceae bacterium]|nr:hypothetical protein [Fimbriimonadaceae bacterium]
MLVHLLAATLLTQQQKPLVPWTFSAPGSNQQEFIIHIPQEPRSPRKVSPLNKWKFDWVVPGLARTPGQPDIYSLRFRTYMQTRDEKVDLGPLVTRALLQLYGFNVRKLKLDHSPSYFRRIVDVYLCDHGKPGGEQRFGEDPEIKNEFGHPERTNQIYIYDLKSFTKPLEMMREVAHEYGHATLPAIGGYSAPESWANGFLGEHLYMVWIARELRDNRLKPVDTLGTTSADLQLYVRNNISPKVKRAATSHPSVGLSRKDASGMDALIGLALYAENILPESAFRRSLMLTGQDPKEYADAVVEASSELKSTQLTIPTFLAGQQIWVPVGKGKLSGAKAIKTQSGWALIKVSSGRVEVKHTVQ